MSSEEKAWIGKNYTVRVRIGHAPPFMLTEGKIGGISIDYLTHIFNRNGIKFQYVDQNEVTWPQALKYIERNCDIIIGGGGPRVEKFVELAVFWRI
ncbi:MAG TPA: transporter substrate-binding domain-containing protein [Deltaproteobacteria bacterium]|nr:transporter substrate-binding domain-containing protein [Deltaproteobacteria bacterium]HIJ40370.1 transporter substrate-binding domain-containing protein [Deltaproteobacteria bacterium]